ncbi:hypothetical protein [Streptomyces sp. NPDC050485]|uniref:deoxynucleotide monophosphate kinase family protein n=1 Tax=Streptomyces sp. NPDC050485 TaxID=3365617 RepID=UPI00378ED125
MRSIGIIGRPRVGKDTVADHLIERHGYERVSIAGPIKELGLIMNPVIGAHGDSNGNTQLVHLYPAVEKHGWEYVKDEYPEVRRFLWAMSVDGIAGTFGPEIWTDLAVNTIRATAAPVVVTDVRLADEAQALRRQGLTIVYLTREGIPEDDQREGEHLGPEHADCRLHNGGTLAELHDQVDALIHSDTSPRRRGQ